MTQNVYLSCFTRKKGRPRQATQSNIIDSTNQKPQPVKPSKRLHRDLLDELYHKKMINENQLQAYLRYRVIYYRFCRLAYVPMMAYNRYNVASGAHQPYVYCTTDQENDALIHKNYVDLRQQMTKEFGKDANYIHHLMLFAQPPLSSADIKLIKKVGDFLKNLCV